MRNRHQYQRSLSFILSLILCLSQINSIQATPHEDIVIEVHDRKSNHADNIIFEIPVDILEIEGQTRLLQGIQQTCSDISSNDVSFCVESLSNPELEGFEGELPIYLEEITELNPTPTITIPAPELEIHISPTQFNSILVPAVEVYLCPPSPVENCVPKFQQVCATYTQNCPNNDCQQTVENECVACSNPDIHTYTPKACPPVPVQCDPYNRPDSCDDNVEPVCGSKANCVSSCNVSFRNKCHACNNPQIVAYVPGTCPSETFPSSPIKFCEPGSSTEITTEVDLVCSYFKNCISEGCSITSLNSKTACSNPLIDYYTPGKCQDDFQITQQSVSTCESHQSTASCENTFDPVCAYFDDSTGPDAATKTFMNKCFACANTNIQYIVSGSCKNEQILMESFCDVNNRPMMCPIGGNSVCGRKIDCEQDNCYETFPSDCFACGKDYVFSYFPGECAQQGIQTKRIYCDPKNRPQSCSEEPMRQTQQVCGVYSEVVNGLKSKTFDTSCAACQNTQIQYYLTGSCTDDLEENLLSEEF